ncbi:MAG: hypothetical protein NC131_17505, partial [Roseburia sp.]|nr:hypothetical protein [Roseburia sp.]
WGANSYGQTGHGTTNTVEGVAPAQIRYMERAADSTERTEKAVTLDGKSMRTLTVAAGDNHLVAVLDDGSAYAMGSNSYGQLGSIYADVDAQTKASRGVWVGLDQRILSLYLNEITWDTTAGRWADVKDDEEVEKTSTPVDYEYVRYVGAQIVLDNDHLGAKTWDTFNLINAVDVHKLEKGDVTYRSMDESVATVTEDGVITVVGFGVSYVIAEYTDPATGYEYSGFVKIYGMPLPENKVDEDGNVTEDVDSIPSLTYPQVGVGENFSVVLRDDGAVWTFGSNYPIADPDDPETHGDGRLGLGTSTVATYPSPQKVIGEDSVSGVDEVIRRIAVGASFVLALTDDNRLFAWGDNTYGQLGLDNIETPYLLKPTEVVWDNALLPGDYIVDIAAGEDYALFLTKLGYVYGVGSNADGKLTLGIDERGSYVTTPTRIVMPSLGQAVDISTNISTSHVLTRAGDVVSWGSNGYGQFGTRYNSLQGPNYAQGDAESNLIALSTGAGSAMAIDVDGKVLVWGDNVEGQLGIKRQELQPVMVEMMENGEPVLNDKGKPVMVELKEQKKDENGELMFDENDMPIMETVMEWVSVYPTTAKMATRDTEFNTTVHGPTYTEVGGVMKPTGIDPVGEPSVALQVAMGQTGYVLYTNLGDAYRDEITGEIITTDNTPYTLMASGLNSHGQLGANRSSGNLPRIFTPVAVNAGDANWRDANARVDNLMNLATSPYGGATLAYDNNYGSVYAWGNNEYGQQGDGTYGDHSMPTMVLIDGGGAYLDISRVLVDDNPDPPEYTASISFSLVEAEASEVKGVLYKADATPAEQEAATKMVSALPGTIIKSKIDMPLDYTIGSVVMVTSSGIVKSMDFTQGDGSGTETAGDALHDFEMPADDVSILVTIVDTKFGSGGKTYSVGLDSLIVAANTGSHVGIIQNDEETGAEIRFTSINRMAGQKVPFVITAPAGQTITGLYYLEDGATGFRPLAYTLTSQETTDPTSGESVSIYTATGSYVVGVGNATLYATFEDVDEAKTTRMANLTVLDNYNPNPMIAGNPSFTNSVTVTSGGRSISVTGATNLKDKHELDSIKPGDEVIIRTNMEYEGYYVVVSVTGKGRGDVLYEVPVDSRADGARFIMPADDVDIEVAFRYGAITIMHYDTMESPKGKITTAITFGQTMRIVVSDIIAYTGFNAYGPFTYTPKPEDLTIISTNELVASVNNDHTDINFGLITAGEQAGYTYIIVTDTRGNTGFFKLGVVPAPEVAEGEEIVRDEAFPMIEVGANHTIALKSDGTVWAWGQNTYGQLGVQRTTVIATTPTAVQTLVRDGKDEYYAPLTDVVKIAASGNHNLALKSDGTVWAWGDNSMGALGLGTLGSSVVYAATQVVGTNYGLDKGMLGTDLNSSSIVDIIAASAVDEQGRTVRQYSMALDKDGRIFAWGTNYHGVTDPSVNRGDELTVATAPVNISRNTALLQKAYTLSADKIAANARLLRKDGQVVTWGENNEDRRTHGGYATDHTGSRGAAIYP